MTDPADRARAWLDESRDGRISAQDAAAIGSPMLQLISLAAEWARPEISGYSVGAVGEGASGALYLGANIEFRGAALAQTIHAEQAVVANAAAHGETGLVRLAVSAPPCGYCRQFLYELASANRLEILLGGRPPARIDEFLPGAFGPADLGVEGGMLDPAAHGLSGIETDPVAQAAVAAANRSYAPYSKAYGGAAIRTGDGRIFAGLYLENAAFNPSLAPLQAALVQVVLGGGAAADVERVAIAQPKDSQVDHHRAAAALLALVAPSAALSLVALS